MDRSPRIIGGEVASPFAYTFLVTLAAAQHINQLDFSFSFCGGSLISDRVVLTAAHCIIDGFGTEKLFVGVHRHDLTEADDEHVCSATIEVESIHAHPDYDTVSMEHDVALLLLKDPAPCVSSGETTTVALDDSATDDRDNELVTVAGWGNM